MLLAANSEGVQLLPRLVSFVRWHRRLIAALLAGLVVAGIVQVASAPPPAGEPVVALAQAVEPGEAISADVLTTVLLPKEAITDSTLTSPDEARGAQAAVGLKPGQVLTRELLLHGGMAAEGKSLVPIAVERPEIRALLSPGAMVQLVVALGDAPEVVCTARIATLPAEAGNTMASARSGNAMVVVEVPTEVAPTVATLGQGGQLSVMLAGHG